MNSASCYHPDVMDKPRVLAVATRNKGKLAEIKDILKLKWRIAGLDEFPSIGEIPEEGKTFEENALAKARAVSQATGLTALADDSGIEVDALGGRPGVYSARFAGEGASDEDNNKKLLEVMKGIPPKNRSAGFVCVMAVVTSDGIEKLVRGECNGAILEAPRGTLGFGYDPLFYYPPMGKTYSEMSPEEKNGISHRFRALSKLKGILPGLLNEDVVK